MSISFQRQFAKLGYDDYEEAELLARLEKLYKVGEGRLLNPVAVKGTKLDALGLTADEVKQKISLVELLGYDPLTAARPVRLRGRPRDDSIPNPLPPAGTELLSCLGDRYIVRGYAYSPRSQRASLVLYEFMGNLISRNLVNLFVGTLPTEEPLVTWPEDPRGLKVQQPVPLGAKRVLTKKGLLGDEKADPDRGWRPKDGPRARGAY